MGYLYEYRVSANQVCNASTATKIRHLSNAGLGYRNGISSVSGDITYELGTPVEARVDAERNSGQPTDYFMTTRAGEFLELDISELNEDISSGFVQQFWFKVVDVPGLEN